MPKESLQKKIGRVRPPRVQITYDVETGGAIEKKELPFVVGVLADLSGQPDKPLPAIKDRKFVEIDRDNFDRRYKDRSRAEVCQHGGLRTTKCGGTGRAAQEVD